MERMTFRTIHDFYKKFPSGFYICSNCGYMTNKKYTCPRCGWRADGLFKTMGNGLIYTISDTNITDEIFIPIESEKGKKHDG